MVDQRAAMGSSARARCDLAMMAAERVNGSCTAKQQMEVGTQQQPSNSLKGPRDASVVRSARAEEGYHRRSPSVTRSHWPAFGKWPSPQRQLKKKSPTSSCLETVGYVVTARNPVPRISLFLLDPKGSLRFAPGFHPTREPFCANWSRRLIRIFLAFGPRGVRPVIILSTRSPTTPFFVARGLWPSL